MHKASSHSHHIRFCGAQAFVKHDLLGKSGGEQACKAHSKEPSVNADLLTILPSTIHAMLQQHQYSLHCYDTHTNAEIITSSNL
eukprot:1064203-Pelagomonas_calceolata.AAC.2